MVSIKGTVKTGNHYSFFTLETIMHLLLVIFLQQSLSCAGFLLLLQLLLLFTFGPKLFMQTDFPKKPQHIFLCRLFQDGLQLLISTILEGKILRVFLGRLFQKSSTLNFDVHSTPVNHKVSYLRTKLLQEGREQECNTVSQDKPYQSKLHGKRFTEKEQAALGPLAFLENEQSEQAPCQKDSITHSLLSASIDGFKKWRALSLLYKLWTCSISSRRNLRKRDRRVGCTLSRRPARSWLGDHFLPRFRIILGFGNSRTVLCPAIPRAGASVCG